MLPNSIKGQLVIGNGFLDTGVTSVILIPAKAGFRLFITKFDANVFTNAAQTVTLEATTFEDIWRFNGNTPGPHGFGELEQGIRVVDGSGVQLSVPVAGPGVSAVVEGYYELVSPGT